MPGVEQRRVNGGLQVRLVMHQPQEQDQLPLVLLVAAGRAERQPSAIRTPRNGGRQGGARAAAAQNEPLPPKDRDGKSLNMPMFMYDIGRSSSGYDPKSTRDCFYNLPKHAKGDIRRLGSHRPSSAVIGQYAWKHKYGRPEYGSSNGCNQFFDRGHLEVKGF